VFCSERASFETVSTVGGLSSVEMWRGLFRLLCVSFSLFSAVQDGSSEKDLEILVTASARQCTCGFEEQGEKTVVYNTE